MDEAERQAAADARHRRAHEAAAPLWGFGAAPIGAGVAGFAIGMAKSDCFFFYQGVRYMKADWWCTVLPSAADESGTATILGFIIGAVGYGIVYALTYAYHYSNS